MGCFLLGIITISMVLMSNTYSYNSGLISVSTGDTYNPGVSLTELLLNQLQHNNTNPGRPVNYQNFPSNHLGHFNTEKKMKLVSIMRLTDTSDQYRFGSSVTNFYIKGTNDFPTVTPSMVGTVMAAEFIR